MKNYLKRFTVLQNRYKDTGCNARQSQYGHSLHNQPICPYL